jgi:holin-like protein
MLVRTRVGAPDAASPVWISPDLMHCRMSAAYSERPLAIDPGPVETVAANRGNPGMHLMSFLNGVTLLLIYQLAGEISVMLLRIPVPGPVLGMIMLFLTLMLRGRSSESLDGASSALLSHLSLLFVPAGVGMMVHFDRIVTEWLPIGIALVLSTVITMVVTALVMSGGNRLLSYRAKKDA